MVSPRTLILECDFNRASLGLFSCSGLRLSLHELAVEYFPPTAAADTNGEAVWIENIRGAFRALRKQTKLRVPATLLLPAHWCLTKFIKVPRVSADQQEKILRFEAEQNIPYTLSDVVWGSFPVSETATEIDTLLATAKLETLDALCDAANEAGFELHAILPAPCATLAGFKLASGNSGKHFLGLNLGERAATLVLVEPGRFAWRTFALGSDHPGTTAGKPEDRAIAVSSESLLARLHQEIARSLLHFQWRAGMTRPPHVYLCGAAATLPGLVAAVSAKLNVTAEVSELRDVIDCRPRRGQRNNVDGSTPNLIDLAGAAAICFDEAHARINLLPPRMLERADYRRRRPWLMAAAAIAMFVLLPTIFHFHSLRSEAAKKSAAIERELAPVRARATRIRKNLQELADLKERITFYQITSGRRDAWIRFLTGLQTDLGKVEDVWLEKLQLAPSTPNAPLKLLVSGRMLDRARPLAKVSPETFSRVNALLTRLARAPFVTAVESERFDHRQPGVLQFDFVLVTDPRQPL